MVVAGASHRRSRVLYIHQAPAGAPGPIVVGFFMDQSFAGTGFHSGCVRDADADAIAATPENFYVNVHSTVFGPGAIRGQLP